MFEGMRKSLASSESGNTGVLLCDGMIVSLELDTGSLELLKLPAVPASYEFCVSLLDGASAGNPIHRDDGPSSAAAQAVGTDLLSTLGSWIGNWLPIGASVFPPTAAAAPANLSGSDATPRGQGVGQKQSGRIPGYLEITGEEAWKIVQEDLEVDAVLDAFTASTSSSSSSPAAGMCREHSIADLAGVDTDLKRIFGYLLPIVAPAARFQNVSRRCLLEPALIVSGGAGSGKTAIASAISSFVADEPALAVHVEWVSCKLLLGRPMQDVLSTIKRAYTRASAKAPSLVVLDDLDQLMPAFEEDAGHGNAQADLLSDELARLLGQQKHALHTADTHAWQVLQKFDASDVDKHFIKDRITAFCLRGMATAHSRDSTDIA